MDAATRRAIAESLRELERLPQMVRESADHFEAIAQDTVQAAQELLHRHHRVILHHFERWQPPRVTSHGEGDVTLEWWKGACVLAIEATADRSIGFLEVWGTNIYEEMHDGVIDPDDLETRLVDLWQRFVARYGGEHPV